MNKQFVPEDLDDQARSRIDTLRRRLRTYREQEAKNLPADSAAREELMEDVPEDVLSLEVQHVAEFAERNEHALTDLTGQVDDLKRRLDKALEDQAFAESDRDKITDAFKALRAQTAGHDEGQRNLPNVLRAGENQHGRQRVANDGTHQPPSGGAPVADPVAAMMGPLRREIQDQIAVEVRRRVDAMPQRTHDELPPGHHRQRERLWTPVEYLTLIGEHTADAELGFAHGVAGQRIVPKTSLPPMDSTLPPPLTEAGEARFREVSPEELQGPSRTKLMSHVYGAETSSHQRRLAFCFDSRDWKTWTTFQNEFKTLAGREGWTPLQKLNQLRSRLSGQTSATVNRVEYVCGRMTSLEDLSAVCQYHVLGETAISDSRSQLESRTRGSDENIREFAYALLDLAQLAYPGSINESMHKACERFISTVTTSSAIKKMLYQNFVGNPCPSIETLASIAIKAERSEELVDQDLHAGSGSKPNSVLQKDGVNISKMQLSTLESQESDSESEDDSEDIPELIAAMRNFPRSRDTSHHRSRRDRSRSRSNSRRSKSRSRSRSGSRNSREKYYSREKHYTSRSRDNDLCYKCGGKGHYSSVCPSPESVRLERKKIGQERNQVKFKLRNHDRKPSKGSNSKTRKSRKDVIKQVVDSVIAYSNAISGSDNSDLDDQEQ